MNFESPLEPEVQMGGHGLYGTVGDYMRFIRCWLNDGAGETVASEGRDRAHGGKEWPG